MEVYFSHFIGILSRRAVYSVFFCIFAGCCLGCAEGGTSSQSQEAAPTMKETDGKPVKSPTAAYKLVFIHHSVGGHWLAHGNGDLVRELNKKNIYVSDITYEWEPEWLTDSTVKRAKRKLLRLAKQDRSGAYNVGDRTDIGQMYDWFSGPDSGEIMSSVYAENKETDRFGDHTNDKGLAKLVAGQENEIVVFKSCYPNTLIKGKPDDKANAASNPPRNYSADSELHTIANAKRTFNDALKYFKSRPDKFFVIVTPPPRLELPEEGRVARGFANWLYNDWLKENNYNLKNVMVFDLYNVLTSGYAPDTSDVKQEQGNHHRIWQGREQHVVAVDKNTLVYPRKAGENHPSPAGLKKATEEFVPLLVENHRRWKEGMSR